MSKKIEHKFGPGDAQVLTAQGIPFSGRIDMLVLACPEEPNTEIVDWKTTSNIQRYAKSHDEMRKMTQVITYLEWFFRQGLAPDEPVRASLVYFQTKGNHAERVTSIFDREYVARRWTIIEGMVKTILHVAAETDIRKVEPNPRACDMARGCPFRDRCPRGDPLGVLSAFPQNQGAVMSLLDRFKMPAAVAPQPQPVPIPPQAPPPAPPPPPLQESAIVVWCSFHLESTPGGTT